MTALVTSGGYFKPAVLGGLVAGVLSALPLVGAGNACCCLWVVCGGLLSAYLLQQDRADSIAAMDGALVGLLAGVIGAVVQFAISIPIGMLIAPFEQQMLERLREMAGAGGPSFGTPAAGTFGLIVFRIFAFFLTLIVSSVVSTIAGLVGAALFARKTPPVPPVPPAPPAPPAIPSWGQDEPSEPAP
jgi:hypothetical protein